jgi:hypothetical protein
VEIENIPSLSEWLSSAHTNIPEVMLLPEVGDSIGRYIFPIGNADRLLQNQWKSWWGAGSQLDEYRTAISNLLEFNKLNQFPSFVVEDVLEGALVDPAGPTFSPGNFDELLPYFAEPVTFAFADFQPQVLLKWVLNQAKVSCLLKQLFHRVKEVKQTLYWTYFGFCGLTWTRRVWFLLHGSHPPKSEPRLSHSQAFGCA